MKKFFMNLFLGTAIVFGATTNLFAGELDVLLDKLVEKGYLTPVEATIIKDETKQQVTKEITQAKSYAVPTWVQKMKIKQDLRLRFQYERKKSDTEGRTRGRVRYRLGVNTDVTDSVKAGIGLATGGDDPRSTNQTFEDVFSTPDIRLDYAYGQWTPTKNLTLIGGKFPRKDFLWAPTDLLWDGDINPEGASLNLTQDITDNIEGFLNGGLWIIDTNDQVDRSDPFMTYVQAGLSAKEEKLDAKGAVTVYSFHGVEGINLPNDSCTNSGPFKVAGDCTGGVLDKDYDSVALSGELGIAEPLELPVERIAIFGDYVKNVSDNVDLDIGWATGFKVGHKSVKKAGQWQMKYIYAHLEMDAFFDIFPDSDRYAGGTNVKSHEVAVTYGLKDNVTFGVDYYNSNRIDGSSDPEHLVQADVLMKF